MARSATSGTLRFDIVFRVLVFVFFWVFFLIFSYSFTNYFSTCCTLNGYTLIARINLVISLTLSVIFEFSLKRITINDSFIFLVIFAQFCLVRSFYSYIQCVCVCGRGGRRFDMYRGCYFSTYTRELHTQYIFNVYNIQKYVSLLHYMYFMYMFMCVCVCA